MTGQPIYPIPLFGFEPQLLVPSIFLPDPANTGKPIRRYDGVSDQTVFDGGSLGATVNGSFTLMAVVEPIATGGPNPVISLETSTAVLAALSFNGGNINLTGDVDDSYAYVGLTQNVPWIIAASHTSGTNKPRFHAKPLVGGSWTHIDGSVTVVNKTSTVSTVRIGSMRQFNGGAVYFGNFNVSAVAIIPAPLSDFSIEYVGSSLTSQAFVDVGASNVLELNQASTSTAVVPAVGSVAQVSQTGTSVISRGPATWTFGVTPPPPPVLQFDGTQSATFNLPVDMFTPGGGPRTVVALIRRNPFSFVGDGDETIVDFRDESGNTWLSFENSQGYNLTGSPAELFATFGAAETGINDADDPALGLENIGDVHMVAVRLDESVNPRFSYADLTISTDVVHIDDETFRVPTGDIPTLSSTGSIVYGLLQWEPRPYTGDIGAMFAWDAWLDDATIEAIASNHSTSYVQSITPAPVVAHELTSDTDIPDLMGGGATFVGTDAALTGNQMFEWTFDGAEIGGGGSTPISGSDTQTFSELSALIVQLSIGASDTITFTDASSSTQTFSRTEAVTFTDVSSSNVTFSRTDADTMTDASSSSQTFSRTDTTTFTDASSSTQTFSRTETETLSESSAYSAALATTESETLTDVSSSNVTFSRTDADTMTDASASSVSFSLTDTSTLSEVVSYLSTLTTTDSWALVETALNDNSLPVSASDSAALGEGSAGAPAFGAAIGNAQKDGNATPSPLVDHVVLTTTADVPTGATAFINVAYYRDDGTSVLTGVTDNGPGRTWTIDYDPANVATAAKRSATVRADGPIPSGTNLTIQFTASADVWVIASAYYLTGVDTSSGPIATAKMENHATSAPYSIGPATSVAGGVAIYHMWNDFSASNVNPTLVPSDGGTITTDYQATFGWRNDSVFAVPSGSTFTATGAWTGATTTTAFGTLVTYPAKPGGSTIAAALALIDALTFTDASSVDFGQIPITASDTLTVSEALSALAAAVAGTIETGSMTDVSSSNVTLSTTETEAASDSSSLTAQSSLVDSATQTELTTAVAIALTATNDPATQSEATANLSALLDRVDSDTFGDASAIAATLATTDSSTFTDVVFSSGQQLSVSASDSWTLADTSALLTQNLINVTDSLVLAEVAALAAALATVDDLTLAEIVALNIASSASDTSALDDSSSITAAFSATDSLTLSEARTLVANASASDAWIASEASAFSAALSATDASAIVEAASLLNALTVSDQATMQEQVALLLSKFAQDDAVMAAAATLLVRAGEAPTITLPTSVAIKLVALSVAVNQYISTVEVRQS